MRSLGKISALLGCLLVATVSFQASAQRSGGFVVDIPDVDNFVVGALGIVPDYMGSDEYTVGIAPAALLKPWENDRYLRLVATELSFNLLNHPTWSFGPVVNYRFPRKDVDDAAVDRMRDIEGAFEFGAFVGWTAVNPKDKRNRFTTSLQLLQDISDEHEGFLISASARYFLPVSRALTLSAGASLTYGSSDYMQTYFGVDANNAARSGLNQFSAEGGIRDIRFPLMAIFSLNPKWHITGGAIISLLTGDAADSPVVDDRGSSTQIFAGLGVAYAW